MWGILDLCEVRVVDIIGALVGVSLRPRRDLGRPCRDELFSVPNTAVNGDD